MKKNKFFLGVGTLLLTVVGAFANAKTETINSYYYSGEGTHCKGSPFIPCGNPSVGCIVFIPDEEMFVQVYRSIASESAYRTSLAPDNSNLI